MILKIQFNCDKENIDSVMKEINTVSPLMLEAEWAYQNYVIIKPITNIFRYLYLEDIIPKLNKVFERLVNSGIVDYYEIGHFS